MLNIFSHIRRTPIYRTEMFPGEMPQVVLAGYIALKITIMFAVAVPTDASALLNLPKTVEEWTLTQVSTFEETDRTPGGVVGANFLLKTMPKTIAKQDPKYAAMLIPDTRAHHRIVTVHFKNFEHVAHNE